MFWVFQDGKSYQMEEVEKACDDFVRNIKYGYERQADFVV